MSTPTVTSTPTATRPGVSTRRLPPSSGYPPPLEGYRAANAVSDGDARPERLPLQILNCCCVSSLASLTGPANDGSVSLRGERGRSVSVVAVRMQK